MNKLHRYWKRIVDVLDPTGDWLALLPIRLLLAYEYGKAGLMKFNGNNWFGNVQDNFVIHPVYLCGIGGGCQACRPS